MTIHLFLLEDPDLKAALEECGRGLKDSGKIHKTTLQFHVPKDPRHEFWSRDSILQDDGAPDTPSCLLEIFAYGGNDSEAQFFAMRRLIRLVDLIRRLLHLISDKPIDKQRQFLEGLWPDGTSSLSVGEDRTQPGSSVCNVINIHEELGFAMKPNCFVLRAKFEEHELALLIARELLLHYKSMKNDMSEKTHECWESISAFLEQTSKKHPDIHPELRNLLTYYNVCPYIV